MKNGWQMAIATLSAILLIAAAPADAAPKKPKPEKPVAPVQPVPGPGDDNSSKPDGTWLLDVTFDAGFVFQDLLTLHKNGTVTENNSILNAASGGNPPFFLIGGDGQGTWERDTAGKITVQFHKMVFCGTLPAAQPGPPPAPQVPCLSANRKSGEFLGFLRTRITGDVNGDKFDSPKGQSETVLIIGTDPLAPPAVNYGPASVVGERLAHPDKSKDAS